MAEIKRWYNDSGWVSAIVAVLLCVVGFFSWVFAIANTVANTANKLEGISQKTEKNINEIQNLKTDSAVIREKLGTIERIVLKIEKKL
jgi:predicted negative regulator of RcsB-dependent stress response